MSFGPCRRLWWKIAVAASLAVLGGCATPEAVAPKRGLPLGEVGGRMSGFVVQVTTARGVGSGLVVRDDGWVATAYSIVEGTHDVRVVLADGRRLTVDLVRIAPEIGGLALLHVEARGLAAASLGGSVEPKSGTRVVAMGNPTGRERILSDAVYNGHRQVNGRSFLQFSVPVPSGAAGGPVVNDDGDVIGVMTNDRPGDRPLDLAVPVENLKTLLASDTLPRPVAELEARAGLSCTQSGELQCAANCWDGFDGLSCVALANAQEEKSPRPAYDAASRGCQLGSRVGCTTAASLATKHHADNRPLLSEAMDGLVAACRESEWAACGMLPSFAKLAGRPLGARTTVDYLDKACAGELRSACTDLAHAYAKGDGVKKSRKRAAEYRRRAKSCPSGPREIVATTSNARP